MSVGIEGHKTKFQHSVQEDPLGSWKQKKLHILLGCSLRIWNVLGTCFVQGMLHDLPSELPGMHFV